MNLRLLNTNYSISQNDALNKIIKNTNNTLTHKIVAYKMEESRGSFFRSQLTEIICKINNEYRLFQYYGVPLHTGDNCSEDYCKCGCNDFEWINIEPYEVLYYLDYFNKVYHGYCEFDFWIPVDDKWHEILNQLSENAEIYKYNEENENIDEEQYLNTLKNNHYYFK